MMLSPSPPAATAAPPSGGGWRPLRWALVASAAVLLWNCGPPYIVGSILGDLPWYEPGAGPATPGQQRDCRAGLARLEQLEKAAGVWPPLRALVGKHSLVTRRAGLLECLGEVGGAREVLRAAIRELEAGIAADPVGRDPLSTAQADAFLVQSHWRSLADLEERAGEREAARAALMRMRELGRVLGGGNAPGELAFGATAALGRFLVRSGDASAARELYRSSLREAEQAAAEEWTLVPLLRAYAELLEAEGAGDAATGLYARIGRAVGATSPLD
jgi:hypothetical protein